jgi:hypothetical protein
MLKSSVYSSSFTGGSKFFTCEPSKISLIYFFVFIFQNIWIQARRHRKRNTPSNVTGKVVFAKMSPQNWAVLRSRRRWSDNILLVPEPKIFDLAPVPSMKIDMKCYKKP